MAGLVLIVVMCGLRPLLAAPAAAQVDALGRDPLATAVRALLDAKADVARTDFTGRSALAYAESARQTRVAEALRASATGN